MKPRRLMAAVSGLFVVVATAGLNVAVAEQPGGAPPATFTKDVAPMSLLTYEDARPWARSIKTRVEIRQMPPWHVDRTVGIRKFKDDPSLSDQEIATLVSWVDAGAPRGNLADTGSRPPRSRRAPRRHLL